jgi:hypothetical protein
LEEKDHDDAKLLELRRISRILLFANADTIEAELSKIANSNGRKKMWVLIDGRRTTKDISLGAGVTTRAVTYFLEDASTAGLAEYTPHRPPSRILDYVPPSWIALLTEKRREADQVQRTDEEEATAEKQTEPVPKRSTGQETSTAGDDQNV